MENNYSYTEYPYGQFPNKFTKNGQKKYFDEISSAREEPTKVATTEIKSTPQTSQNNLNISSLIPLIKLMGNKKSMSTTDMLSMFLPLLGGENSAQISEIMQLMKSDNSQAEEVAEDLTVSSMKIDEYKRVN